MSIAELLIVLLVAALAFGPKQLPMLARHLGQLAQKLQTAKAQWQQYWQNQLKEVQLLDNEQKAKIADTIYLQAQTSETVDADETKSQNC